MKQRRSLWLMLVPLYVFTLVFVAGPLVYMFILSFETRAETWGVVQEFTLDNYKNIFQPVYLQTFAESFRLAIRETSQMTGGHPGLGIHQNRAVHAHIVGILLYKLLPPGALYVILQLHAQITVIPGVRQTSVNLGTRVYKASRFRQSHDFVHCLFHIEFSLSNSPAGFVSSGSPPGRRHLFSVLFVNDV